MGLEESTIFNMKKGQTKKFTKWSAVHVMLHTSMLTLRTRLYGAWVPVPATSLSPMREEITPLTENMLTLSKILST